MFGLHLPARGAPAVFAAASLLVFASAAFAQAQAPAPEPAAPAAAPAATPVTPDATTTPPDAALPDLNPAEWFDGKMGGTFGEKTVNAFTRSRQVAIVGFRVVFVTHNEARAITRASYLPGRDTTGAKASMEVDLQGVSDKMLQAITDEAYARFVAQLKTAGRDVITPADMKWDYSAFKLSTSPMDVNSGKLRGRAFAPTGTPLWWQVGEVWGDAGLGQTNMRAMNEASQKAGAPVTIAPMIEIDFAQMMSSGNRSGLVSRRAEVGATLAMTVRTFSTRVVRAEETRYGGIVFKGDDGGLALTRGIDTDIEFATLKESKKEEGGLGSAIFSALVMPTKKASRIAETTDAAYSYAANAVLKQASGAFARLFVTNPAK